MGTVVQTITTTGTTNWVAPGTVTTVQVELWGGGGTGGPATGTASGAGGGAGGQYAIKQVTVTPGNTYAVVVAAVKTSATTVGNGNDSTFATTTVVAKGGVGGAAATGATSTGGAGSTTSGVGDTVFAGGSGATGVSSTASGGGGSGAGSTGTGNSGSGGTAGEAKANNGGAGGAGVATANTRNAGSNYGGGGSGGLSSSATDRAGGNGAQGLAVLTYTLPATDTLTNDFTAQNSPPWIGYGTGVAVVSGQLNLTPTTSVERLLSAAGPFDLTASYAYVECAQFPNDGAQCWMGMVLRSTVDTTDEEEFLIYKNGPTGDLQYRENINGVQDATTVAWDAGGAITHRWWKISESGGNILWDTSPDGTTWTNRRTKTKGAIDVTSVTVRLLAYSDAVSPGVYKFDNFNTAPSTTPASLPIMRARPNYGSLLQL